MSTWHQDKAGPLRLPPGWFIQHNPPHTMRSLVGPFGTREAADTRLAEMCAEARTRLHGEIGDLAYSSIISGPLATLQHHVTGAIERGEAQPITEKRK